MWVCTIWSLNIFEFVNAVTYLLCCEEVFDLCDDRFCEEVLSDPSVEYCVLPVDNLSFSNIHAITL